MVDEKVSELWSLQFTDSKQPKWLKRIWKKKDIIGHQTMIIFKDGAHNDALSSMTSSQGAKKIIFEASIY